MNSMTDKVPVSVGILAGGKSRRMGCDKALIELNNETMLARLVRELSGCGEVLISASEKGAYESFGARVVYDENRDIGPIEGIRRLVSEAKSEYVFICATDMPFINADMVDYIREFISSDYDCFVITDDEHIHPLCAIYSKRILGAVEDAVREGKYRLREILDRVRCKYISISPTKFDKKILKNVNTKDELVSLTLPVIFAVSGYKNTGKTWLIEKLINEFIKKGYSVGIIKHDAGDHIVHARSTDTFRYKSAGAAVTAVFSGTEYVLNGGRRSVDDLIDDLGRQSEPPNIIILEGFRDSKYPKIEIVKKSVSPHIAASIETLICISTDCILPCDVNCPVFAPDDITGIFSCITDYFWPCKSGTGE